MAIGIRISMINMTPDFSKLTEKLIPAIIQDTQTGHVLMLGFMNEEAYAKTQKEKRVTFYSRTKKRLWTKGEESGNFLNVNEILQDCDNDTILIKATPVGSVCHTGADTCFNEKNTPRDFLTYLESVIESRKKASPDSSYTAKLFAKGINKIAQKVGEEAVETVIEAKDDNRELFKNEVADLLFHLLVLLSAKKIKLEDVIAVLKKRHIKD